MYANFCNGSAAMVHMMGLCWVPAGKLRAARFFYWLAPDRAAGTQQLQGAMDKMKNLAIKRDEGRMSFIGDPTKVAQVTGGDGGDDDLSSYL